ncbi:E3 ubiquitin-protein ligase RHF1A [Abrus precatorius]|uniref:RING-type E3 ubiquitin transferase n=1 Tax=Abrus precatorius TaxID=3816 RepID=A0A8B8M477_ABRPR|nr:E3 ubiquitin-protein ligase RHF1A [Abrus precatorius]
MGSLCSCFKRKNPEEETVQLSEIANENLTFAISNTSNKAENSPVAVASGEAESSNSNINRLDSGTSKTSQDNVCPTCFEEYSDQNPKIVTKCNHHYHLSCICDWRKRSRTCPACRQELVFDGTK